MKTENINPMIITLENKNNLFEIKAVADTLSAWNKIVKKAAKLHKQNATVYITKINIDSNKLIIEMKMKLEG